ncbi:MAG TPA: MFS transporter [Chloroflexia bacterium]
MDQRADANPEPDKETGPEVLPGAPPEAPAPSPPLPTRRVVRAAPLVDVETAPPAEADAVATVDVVSTEEASPPALLGEATDGLTPEVATPVEAPAIEEEAAPGKGIFAGISRNVFVMGLVSFFTDVGTEMIVPVRILFLVTVLQTPLALAGLIEGIAASTASLLAIVSGRLADRTRRRKPLMLFGYGLSSAVKPLLAFAGSWQAALGLIFLERVGKGVRGSPRDAMLADATPVRYLGKAFGFHRSLDTLGAAVGPLLAYLVLLLTNDDVRAVFAWTVVPGALSVLVLALFLRERGVAHAVEVSRPVRVSGPKVAAPALGKRFWMFTAISVVFAFGNSSDAFIFLRTADLGDSLLLVPLVYFGFNVVYALLATPLGALSDRFGRLPVLLSGYTVFALVYLGWAVAVEGWNAWVLFLVYGVYAAATEGIGRAFVADIVPQEARGTALGWFGGLVSLAALPANLIAGWLWSTIGPSATFTFGMWSAVVAVALTLAWLPWLRSKADPEMAYTSAQDAQTF